MRARKGHRSAAAMVAWLMVAAPFTACERVRESSLQPAAGFVISLNVTGGFTGRGLGAVTLESDGRVTASRPTSPAPDAPSCRSQLSAAEIESLRQAVEAADLQAWPATFDPADDNGCCDRFRWTLRVDRRDGRQPSSRSTAWHDGNEARLLKEVTIIRDIAARALTRTLEKCQ